jgi:hypothetical protein
VRRVAEDRLLEAALLVSLDSFDDAEFQPHGWRTPVLPAVPWRPRTVRRPVAAPGRRSRPLPRRPDAHLRRATAPLDAEAEDAPRHRWCRQPVDHSHSAERSDMQERCGAFAWCSVGLSAVRRPALCRQCVAGWGDDRAEPVGGRLRPQDHHGVRYPDRCASIG